MQLSRELGISDCSLGKWKRQLATPLVQEAFERALKLAIQLAGSRNRLEAYATITRDDTLELARRG